MNTNTDTTFVRRPTPMMGMNVNRVPAGVPTGGQFAPTNHVEADLQLDQTTTNIDTTANITSNATVGDLIDTIQAAIDDDYSRGPVVVVTDTGTLWRYRPDDVPSYAAVIIDVDEQQAAGDEPATAEELADMAIELGWVDHAIEELAYRQAQDLYVPHRRAGNHYVPSVVYDRDVDTEYVVVVYDMWDGVAIVTADSDLYRLELEDLKVVAVLAEPGEKVSRDELEERIGAARDSIKDQIEDIIRGSD